MTYLSDFCREVKPRGDVCLSLMYLSIYLSQEKEQSGGGGRERAWKEEVS